MESFLARKVKVFQTWHQTESNVNWSGEYKLSSFYSNTDKVPDYLSATFQTGIYNNSYVAVQCDSQMNGRIDSLRKVLENDSFLSVLKPKFIRQWKTGWRDTQTDAFIRHVQIGDFLPIFNLAIDAYGIAIPLHSKNERKVFRWYVGMLTPDELNEVNKHVLTSERNKEQVVTNKWIEARVPIIYCEATQTTPTKVDCRLYMLCNLDYIPFATYSDVVLRSVVRGITNIAEFASSEL